MHFYALRTIDFIFTFCFFAFQEWVDATNVSPVFARSVGCAVIAYRTRKERGATESVEGRSA